MRAAQREVKLSPKQLEVINLIAKGMSYDEAAQEMGCSKHNVNHRLRDAWDKLGARGRSDGLVKATRLGLIQFSFTMFAALLSSLLYLEDDEMRPRKARKSLAEIRIRIKEA